MSYLLGFPTPVVEILLILVVLVLGSALYFGYRFKTVPIDTESRAVKSDTVEQEARE